MRKTGPITMLSILLLMLAAIKASAAINATFITATAITDADATAECNAGVGRPGAFYWCKEKYFGNFDHCDYWFPNKACWYIKSLENARRSIGSDYGGYCKFYKGLDCTGPPMNIHIGGKVTNRLKCPGSGDMQGIEETSMRCFAY